jgi:hypothetical protein
MVHKTLHYNHQTICPLNGPVKPKRGQKRRRQGFSIVRAAGGRTSAAALKSEGRNPKSDEESWI